jgi:hypothetical protein
MNQTTTQTLERTAAGSSPVTRADACGLTSNRASVPPSAPLHNLSAATPPAEWPVAMTIGQVATVLQITPSAVAKRLQRGQLVRCGRGRIRRESVLI